MDVLVDASATLAVLDACNIKSAAYANTIKKLSNALREHSITTPFLDIPYNQDLYATLTQQTQTQQSELIYYLKTSLNQQINAYKALEQLAFEYQLNSAPETPVLQTLKSILKEASQAVAKKNGILSSAFLSKIYYQFQDAEHELKQNFEQLQGQFETATLQRYQQSRKLNFILRKHLNLEDEAEQLEPLPSIKSLSTRPFDAEKIKLELVVLTENYSKIFTQLKTQNQQKLYLIISQFLTENLPKLKTNRSLTDFSLFGTNLLLARQNLLEHQALKSSVLNYFEVEVTELMQKLQECSNLASEELLITLNQLAYLQKVTGTLENSILPTQAYKTFFKHILLLSSKPEQIAKLNLEDISNLLKNIPLLVSQFSNQTPESPTEDKLAIDASDDEIEIYQQQYILISQEIHSLIIFEETSHLNIPHDFSELQIICQDYAVKYHLSLRELGFLQAQLNEKTNVQLNKQRFILATQGLVQLHQDFLQKGQEFLTQQIANEHQKYLALKQTQTDFFKSMPSVEGTYEQQNFTSELEIIGLVEQIEEKRQNALQTPTPSQSPKEQWQILLNNYLAEQQALTSFEKLLKLKGQAKPGLHKVWTLFNQSTLSADDYQLTPVPPIKHQQLKQLRAKLISEQSLLLTQRKQQLQDKLLQLKSSLPIEYHTQHYHRLEQQLAEQTDIKARLSIDMSSHQIEQQSQAELILYDEIDQQIDQLAQTIKQKLNALFIDLISTIEQLDLPQETFFTLHDYHRSLYLSQNSQQQKLAHILGVPLSQLSQSADFIPINTCLEQSYLSLFTSCQAQQQEFSVLKKRLSSEACQLITKLLSTLKKNIVQLQKEGAPPTSPDKRLSLLKNLYDALLAEKLTFLVKKQSEPELNFLSQCKSIIEQTLLTEQNQLEALSISNVNSQFQQCLFWLRTNILKPLLRFFQTEYHAPTMGASKLERNIFWAIQKPIHACATSTLPQNSP